MGSIQHKSAIVEATTRQSFYQAKAVTRKLGIAPNTLYLKLKNASLDNRFIARMDKSYTMTPLSKVSHTQDSACAKDIKMNHRTTIHTHLNCITDQKLNNKYLQLLENRNKPCTCFIGSL